ELVEEFTRQVLPAVIKIVDVALVEREHRAEALARRLLAFDDADRNPALRDRAPLSLDLVAPVAAERTEIIVERLVAAVLPVELEPDTRDYACPGERLSLVLAAEIHMRVRDLILPCDLGQRPPHRLNERPAVRPCGQEARAGHGRERHADENLRVIRNAEAMGEFRPFVIEDEFAHAVELEIHRARADHL